MHAERKVVVIPVRTGSNAPGIEWTKYILGIRLKKEKKKNLAAKNMCPDNQNKSQVKNGDKLIQVDSPERRNKRTKLHNENQRRNISLSAWMEVERAAPSDRPHGRPVSRTFMKQHHALSNWTNIVKTSKKNAWRRWQAVPTTVRTEPNIPVRNPTLNVSRQNL